MAWFSLEPFQKSLPSMSTGKYGILWPYFVTSSIMPTEGGENGVLHYTKPLSGWKYRQSSFAILDTIDDFGEFVGSIHGDGTNSTISEIGRVSVFDQVVILLDNNSIPTSWTRKEQENSASFLCLDGSYRQLLVNEPLWMIGLPRKMGAQCQTGRVPIVISPIPSVNLW